MIIKQLSIFIENKKGHLALVTNVLRKENIDIRAISVFDTSEFGILRMVVNKPEEAVNALKEAGYTAKVSKVLAIQPEDRPGSLNEIFNILDENNIDIEYIYSFVMRKRDMPFIIFKVRDEERAIDVLKKYHIQLVAEEEIYEGN